MSRPIPPADERFPRPTSTTDSEQATKRTNRFSDVLIQFAGDFAGGWDVDLEGSNDGTNWVSIQATITAATEVTVTDHWKFMRVTADTVGTDADSALLITMSGLSDP